MDLLRAVTDNLSSIITFLFGGAGIPLAGYLIREIISWFGPFAGTYLAVTQYPGKNGAIIETVKCQHFRDKLYGKISGYSSATIANGVLQIVPKKWNYRFDGKVSERLFVISYRATDPEVISSGTLVLLGASSGQRFDGVWAGFDEGKIVHSKCLWVKVKNEAMLKDPEFLTPYLENLITEPSPWSDEKIFHLVHAIGMGKAAGQKTTLYASDGNFNIKWFQPAKNEKPNSSQTNLKKEQP